MFVGSLYSLEISDVVVNTSGVQIQAFKFVRFGGLYWARVQFDVMEQDKS